MKLGRKNDKKLCIVTAYRIVQEKGTQLLSINYNTSYWQQLKAFITNVAVDPNPQNKVLHNLPTFISKLKAEGHEAILMMDANESTKAKNSKISEFVDEKSTSRCPPECNTRPPDYYSPGKQKQKRFYISR